MRKFYSILILSIIFGSPVFGQISEGTLEIKKISSTAIDDNLFADSRLQDVAIYLPPSYKSNPDKKYPVLYFLPGYYDKVATWVSTGEFQGFKLKQNMDKLINEGGMKEMIVVIPNSFTFLEGSFYTNSDVNGKYEQFYTQELIEFIDTSYRVLNTRDSRAIAGHSMGGSGALDLSMKHADKYCIGYGLCSGLFAPNWVEESPLFSDKAQINRYFDLRAKLDTMSRDEAHTQYMAAMRKLQWLERFMYAYGTAFAADTIANAPYIDYPFYKENDVLKIDSVKLERWEEGFGNLEEKIEKYKENLLSLKAYVLDYGSYDYFKYIVSGNKHFHNLLTKAAVPHTFIDNRGDHVSKVSFQIENSIMPLCSDVLTFDTSQLNNEAKILGITINKQVGDAIFDTEKKSIVINVGPLVNLSNLKPAIQTSLGAQILPSSRSTVDFSNGPQIFTVVSEDEKTTETWTISVVKTETAVNSKKNVKLVGIFPNPVNDFLYIENAEILKSIEIYNYLGVIIFSGKPENSKLNVTNYSSGIYMVQLCTNKGNVITKKFIKK